MECEDNMKLLCLKSEILEQVEFTTTQEDFRREGGWGYVGVGLWSMTGLTLTH